MNEVHQEKGITLIALAVTIIVILIIAGISIGTISGNDSTINKANDVRNAVNNKEESDAIKISIQETMLLNDKGELDAENFERILREHLVEVYNFYYDETQKKYTFTAYPSGITYVVNSKGEIE